MAVAAIAGSAIVGTVFSGLGSKSAGKISSRNAKRALAETKRQFDLVFETLAPFRDLGESAITELENFLVLGAAQYVRYMPGPKKLAGALDAADRSLGRKNLSEQRSERIEKIEATLSRLQAPGE